MRFVVWFSAALAVGIYICTPIQDPDLWWHITVGRWILTHKTVPHVDYWSMFSVGEPWRAYSWSSEILFALVEAAFGVSGLLALKLLLGALLALCLSYCLGRMAQDWFVGALLGLYCTAACFNHFTLRPQSFVWIYFIGLLFVADQISQKGFSARRCLALFSVMLLWANTHLSAALGIAALAAWLWPKQSSVRAIVKMPVKGVLFAFLGTLATPYLGGEWATFFHKTGHPFHFQIISEFQPATILQYSAGFLIVIAGFLAALLFRQPRSVSLPKILLCAVFCIGALAVVKFLPFAVIAIAAAAASGWKDSRAQGYSFGNLSEAVEKLRRLFAGMAGEGFSFLLIAVVIVNIIPLWRAPLELSVVPKQAVDFIEEQSLAHPVLNPFGVGGYLMYRFSDDMGNPVHLVSIDGRTNLITDDLWKKHDAAFKGKSNWREYLELVKPQTILWRTDSALVSILLAENKWCLVFRSGASDEGFAVFIPRGYWDGRSEKLPSENCS